MTLTAVGAPPRVPLRRVAQPNLLGFEKPVVVSEVLMTIGNNGRPIPIDYENCVFALDWDGLFVKTEDANKEGWKLSYRMMARSLSGAKATDDPQWEKTAKVLGLSGEELRDLFGACDLFIDQVFDPGSGVGFGELAPGLFNYFGEAFRFQTVASLENALSDFRDTEVLRRADQGEVRLMPGARHFLETLSREGWMRGLVTANASNQVVGLMNLFFGKKAEELLPPRHRIFGREESQCRPDFKNKPAPDILYLLCEQFGAKIVRTIVVDDRPDMIKRAILARCFAAVWITPDITENRQKFEKELADLKASLKERFKRVVVAPSLEHIRWKI